MLLTFHSSLYNVHQEHLDSSTNKYINRVQNFSKSPFSKETWSGPTLLYAGLVVREI